MPILIKVVIHTGCCGSFPISQMSFPRRCSFIVVSSVLMANPFADPQQGLSNYVVLEMV